MDAHEVGVTALSYGLCCDAANSHRLFTRICNLAVSVSISLSVNCLESHSHISPISLESSNRSDYLAHSFLFPSHLTVDRQGNPMH